MKPSIWNRAWAVWDAWFTARLRLAAYHVTPRQGRHVVRRRLLRALRRRLSPRVPGRFNSLRV